MVLPSRASSVLTRRVFLVCLFLSLSQLKREKTGLFDANTHFLEKNRDAAHAPNVPKMLRKCAKSKRLLDALEHGVFDALKKGYLRSVALVISHPEDHSTLLEEYLFTVEYDGAKRARLLATVKDAQKEMGKTTKKDEARLTDPKWIRKNAIATTRTLLSLMRTLDALPDGSAANLNLTYTEETPATYEPPFFQAADDATVDENDDFYHDGSKTWKSDPFTMGAGKIETKYHSMTVKASSALDPLLEEEDEEEEEEREDDVVIEEQVKSDVTRKTTAGNDKKEKRKRATRLPRKKRYPEPEIMKIYGGIDPNANAVPETQCDDAFLVAHTPVAKRKRDQSPESKPKSKRVQPQKASTTPKQALASLKQYIETTCRGTLQGKWIAKVTRRKTGRDAGHHDVTYFDPNGKRYRSKIQVARSLNLHPVK